MTGARLLNNRYQILRSLGQGGFGETFLAQDTYLPSSRPCAIKQLRPSAGNQQHQQLLQGRFQTEAAVLEKLGESSNQIPKLYAYFAEGGQFYLVQEFIEGESLTAAVQRQGNLSDNAAQDILISLLQVLEIVHSQRLLHRDIKPDNIILRASDRQPVLIDFGAVKEAIATVANPAAHSIAIGTPGFMPPEQAAGKPVFASDLYSLSLTIIYLLTGRWPQEFATDPQTGAILWRQLAPAINPHLAMVLDRAIQYQPAQRYATAREMLAALSGGTQAATQATVAAVPPARAIATPSHSAPGQKAILAGIAVAAALIGVGIAASRLFVNSPPASNTASSPVPSVEPAAASSPSPSPSFTPSPAPTSSSPAPTPAASPSPSPTRSPSPSPSATATPAVSPSLPVSSPTPSATISPSPVPSATAAPATPSNASIPAFPVGTAREAVEAVLGKPPKDVSGQWKTRAVTYNFVPNQIDLGYLFDRNSGVLQQTEASFAESADPQLTLKTLDSLLQGKMTPDIQQGLQQVQQRQRSSYTFTSGSWRGQIVRQNCGFIYISIWNSSLHDFNVAESRQC